MYNFLTRSGRLIYTSVDPEYLKNEKPLFENEPVTSDTTLNKQEIAMFLIIIIFASQGLRFGYPFSPPLADLEYILKFARNATWWFIEVAPFRKSSSPANQNRFVIRMLES